MVIGGLNATRRSWDEQDAITYLISQTGHELLQVGIQIITFQLRFDSSQKFHVLVNIQWGNIKLLHFFPSIIDIEVHLHIIFCIQTP